MARRRAHGHNRTGRSAHRGQRRNSRARHRVAQWKREWLQGVQNEAGAATDGASRTEAEQERLQPQNVRLQHMRSPIGMRCRRRYEPIDQEGQLLAEHVEDIRLEVAQWRLRAAVDKAAEDQVLEQAAAQVPATPLRGV
eukprot:5392040-Prymnesium_polylepis.1